MQPNTRPLPPMPRQIAALPVHRGFPVPWFVAVIDGTPDFRIVDSEKHERAVRQRRCMVCGRKLGREFAFPLGPMCAVNLTSAEAPSCVECVDWSARACPFLSRPNMVRRENDLPAGHKSAGVSIRRNPGVTLVWVTETYNLFDAGNGVLFHVGKPKRITAYREGRRATPEEITESIASGLPLLARVAADEGPDAVAELERLLGNAAVRLGLDSRTLQAACLDAMKVTA